MSKAYTSIAVDALAEKLYLDKGEAVTGECPPAPSGQPAALQHLMWITQ